MRKRMLFQDEQLMVDLLLLTSAILCVICAFICLASLYAFEKVFSSHESDMN